ncbi:MAG TPA: winged helix DNA-binding domain-containing protein [Gaiellaceae bacterium]|nr:winged helix DNA-binding domain-containing protein [Gaiellaceae bacterium]HWJ45663.1 winged helix DNA-binding domain-containing protein [Gaiellaceae bacterium]
MRARRLARSSLADRSPSLVDVVRQTGGIHAQVQASAELQLAARVDGITQQDVRDALWRDRTLVKAWTLRGTLHLHPADELPLWVAARSQHEDRALPEWRDPARTVHPAVSAEESRELQAAFWDSAGAEPLLREELVDEVVRHAGKKHEGRLRSGFAFFTGELCQGPPKGNKITLVRPDRWIGNWRRVQRDDAVREIVRRFLHAYGPARPADFREWFGADAPFDLVDVDEVDIEGHRAFVLAGDTEFPELGKSVRLLPEYDVYVMGFREREHLVPERVRDQVAAHGRGRYEGPAGVRFLLVNGVTAGLWGRKKLATRLEVRVAPARRFRRKALEQEVDRYAAFLGVEPALTVE